MERILLLLSLTLLVIGLHGRPVSVTNDRCEGIDDDMVKLILGQFGYLAEGTVTTDRAVIATLVPDAASYQSALQTFQGVWGLQKTGTLSSETCSRLNAARCGVDDRNLVQEYRQEQQQQHRDGTRTKRYVLFGTKWADPSDVTWTMVGCTPDIANNAKTLRQFENAFMKWQKAANITFRYLDSAPADIEIYFASGDHGDEYPFDGPGTVLAHAYYPSGNDEDGLPGDMHFDEDETWRPFPRSTKIGLREVALHEIGHAIGLRHSMKEGAIMGPYYQRLARGQVRLRRDDKRGARALYGKRTPES